MRYIICYDIREQRVRARVVKVLERLGTRIQYSVFTAELTERELAALQAELTELTASSEMRTILILPTCAACPKGRWQLGEFIEEDERAFVVV